MYDVMNPETPHEVDCSDCGASFITDTADEATDWRENHAHPAAVHIVNTHTMEWL